MMVLAIQSCILCTKYCRSSGRSPHFFPCWAAAIGNLRGTASTIPTELLVTAAHVVTLHALLQVLDRALKYLQLKAFSAELALCNDVLMRVGWCASGRRRSWRSWQRLWRCRWRRWASCARSSRARARPRATSASHATWPPRRACLAPPATVHLIQIHAHAKSTPSPRPRSCQSGKTDTGRFVRQHELEIVGKAHWTDH